MRLVAKPLLFQATCRLCRITSRPFHPSPLRARSPTTSETQSEHEPAANEHRKTSPGAPKPKISNLSVPGVDTAKHLSGEQKQEVQKHNEEFEKRPEHEEEQGQEERDDRVDKEFWAGHGTRENPGVSKPKSGSG